MSGPGWLVSQFVILVRAARHRPRRRDIYEAILVGLRFSIYLGAIYLAFTHDHIHDPATPMLYLVPPFGLTIEASIVQDSVIRMKRTLAVELLRANLSNISWAGRVLVLAQVAVALLEATKWIPGYQILGLNEISLFGAALIAIILGYSELTYFRIRRGYFGDNCFEIVELIQFAGSSRDGDDQGPLQGGFILAQSPEYPDSEMQRAFEPRPG